MTERTYWEAMYDKLTLENSKNREFVKSIVIKLQTENKSLKASNKELLEALETVSPIIDGLINRTHSGKKRNELCNINVQIKTLIQNNISNQ